MARQKGNPESQAADNRDIEIIEAITPKQQQLIELLLHGNTLKQAAKLTDVSNRTAIYWMNAGPVRVEYDLQLAQMVRTLRDRVQNIQGLALDSLEYFLSAEAPPALRFQAMKMILEYNLLQKHFDPRASSPQQAESIVHEAASQAHVNNPQRMNDVLLYDDRNRQRIPEGF